MRKLSHKNSGMISLGIKSNASPNLLVCESTRRYHRSKINNIVANIAALLKI